MVTRVGNGLHRLLRPESTALARCICDAPTLRTSPPDGVVMSAADVGAWDPYRFSRATPGGEP